MCLRVGAHRPDGDEPPDPRSTRALHQLDAHHSVLVEEAAGVCPVGADPPDDGRQVHHDVGTRVGERPVDRGGVAQVVVRAPGHEDLGGAGVGELGDDATAEEPGAAGHHHARPGQLHRQSTRPIHRSRLAAYHSMVSAMPSSQDHRGFHPVSPWSFSYPTRSARTSLEPGRIRSGTETSRRSPQCPRSRPSEG